MSYTSERSAGLSGFSGLGCACRGGMGCCPACTAPTSSGLKGLFNYGDLAWKVVALQPTNYGYMVTLKEVKRGVFSDDDTGRTTTDTWPSWGGPPPAPGDDWPGAPDQQTSVDPNTIVTPQGPSTLSQIAGAVPGLFQTAGNVAGQFFRPQAPVQQSSGAGTAVIVGLGLLGLGLGVAAAVKSRRKGRRR